MPPDKIDLLVTALNDFKLEIREDLTDIKSDLRTTRQQLAETRETVAGLKVKAGAWGAMAGLIPALLAAIWLLFERVKP